MNNTPTQFADSWGKPAALTLEKPPTANDPAPAVRSVRAKLKTVGDVSQQIAVIYREARSGKLDISDASKLANILALLARTLADGEIESRLERLEGRSL